MTPEISSHVQKLDLGKKITLVHINLSLFGEEDLFWVLGDEGAVATQAVTFDGQEYVPFPFDMTGFEMTGVGPLPRPTFGVADVNEVLTPLVLQNGNFIGATVRRIVTYKQFLDGEPDADPDSVHPIDEFELTKKTFHRPGERIQWEMRAAHDVEGAYLPGRQAVRDFCDLEYRRWVSGTTFDYTNATCPYAGTNYFDENGDPTTAEHDNCPKLLGIGCKVRFGANNELPFGGFPGLARIRIR